MRLTPFIALRHLGARVRSTVLTALGVALGVAVMSVMASMLLGLQGQFIQNVVETTPNVTVSGEMARMVSRPTTVPIIGEMLVALSRRPPPKAVKGIRNYRETAQAIARLPGVVAVAPELSGEALLSYGTRVRPVQLTGVLPEEEARAVLWRPRLRAVRGELATARFGAVIGIEAAKDLGAPSGVHLTLTTTPELGQRIRAIAFYQSGIRPIDESITYVNLSLAQTLLARPGQVSTLAVRVRDINQAPEIATRIQALTGLRARSWQEVNATFFSVFRLQNTLTAVMIAFIVTVAGFGITNGLITLILEKQREIGILKALGATNDRVAAIFLLEGLLMGVLGAMLGMGLAAVGIHYLGQVSLQGEGQLTTARTFTLLRTPAIYLIPALVALVVSVLASLLPVRRAAGYDPVEIIRSAR